MEWRFAQEVGTVLSRSGPKSNAMGQVGGGATLSYPQDRSCSVLLFARYFVIVISCVVLFYLVTCPDRAFLADVFRLIAGTCVGICFYIIIEPICEIFFWDINYY